MSDGKEYTLILGSKNTSSWSLRAWLVLKRCGLDFQEHLIEMRQPDTKSKILHVSPSGYVPALRRGDLLICDTLAIAEYMAEQFPDLALWPAESNARAIARSVSAEMHSGFGPLRQTMPMDFLGRESGFEPSPEARVDIERIEEIWTSCRRDYGSGGPYLFGAFGIADAMFAPVVSRFTTYQIPLNDTARAYADAVWQWPDMVLWQQQCRAAQDAS